MHVTDRFSMAHSVEARVPLLDHELIELVYQIPASIRTSSHDPKYLLRDTLKEYLPPEILNRPKKGFSLPLPIWTRGRLKNRIQEFLNPSFLKKQDIFSPRVWSHIVKPHLDGRRDYTKQVWALFMFQLWFTAKRN